MNLPGMPHLGTYRIIAADPPWAHNNYGQAKHGAAKSAEKCAYCDHPWSDHDPHLVAEDAPGMCGNPQCGDADIVGCEQFVARARRGPGSYSMQGVEDVWLGVKDGIETWSKDRARRDIPEIVFAPIGEHSAKPESVYDRIEALWPNATPRLELFSRRRRPGWNHWGNEAPECDLVFGREIGATWPVATKSLVASLREAVGDAYDQPGSMESLKALREDA
jgi:hypothetical protein